MKVETINALIWILGLSLLLTTPSECIAQDEDDLIEYYRYKGKDTVKRSPLTQAQIRLRNIRPTERFDVQLSWGFLLAGNMPDTVPVRVSASGSRIVGLSLNYLLSPNWILKLQPGFSFFKVTFEQSQNRTFPMPADSSDSEKLRSEYVDLSLGIAYVLQADTGKGKFISLIEIGFGSSRLIGSSYKLTRFEKGQNAKLKIPGIPDINKWRAGFYARLSYRFVGIWSFYRLTSIFEVNERSDGFIYPLFPRWELGFSIIL